MFKEFEKIIGYEKVKRDLELICDIVKNFEKYEKLGVTFPGGMLMYGKEASNRKQEIDRQHYTIPNQRPKNKHCGKI